MIFTAFLAGNHTFSHAQKISPPMEFVNGLNTASALRANRKSLSANGKRPARCLTFGPL